MSTYLPPVTLHGPTLDDDVLRLILMASHCETHAALLLTCRYFNHEVAKITLSYSTTYVSDDRIAKFTRFLRAEDHSRPRYVQNLHLNIDLNLSEDLEHELAESILRMCNLHTLAIQPGEVALAHQELFAALAVLPSLRRLDIPNHTGLLACRFLRELRTENLTSIHLVWYDDSADYEDFFDEGLRLTPAGLDAWPQYHAVPLLARWATTLEEIEAVKWYSYAVPRVPLFTHIYPNMTRLCLVCDTFAQCAPYIRAFPNLACLNLRGGVVGAGKPRVELRQANIDSQWAGTWQHLQGYFGHTDALYIFGLTCRIPRMEIYATATLSLLPDMLSYAKPVHLMFNEILDQRMTDPSVLKMAGILQTDGASCLENISMTVRFVGSSVSHYVASVEELILALTCLPLRRVRLTIWRNTKDLPRVHEAFSDSSAGPEEMRLWERLRPDTTMQRLAAAIPSLADAIVAIGGRDGVPEAVLLDEARCGDLAEEWRTLQ